MADTSPTSLPLGTHGCLRISISVKGECHAVELGRSCVHFPIESVGLPVSVAHPVAVFGPVVGVQHSIQKGH